MSSGRSRAKYGIVTVNQRSVGAQPAVPGASSNSGHSLQGPETGNDAPDPGMEAGAC